MQVPDFSLVVTVKNRRDHFLKTFSSMVTQLQPQKYELVFVDFDSNDDFEKLLRNTVVSHRELFSKSLVKIKRIFLEFSCPFNSGKAKNLGSKFCDSKWISFSDVDVFLGMGYHGSWMQILENCDSSFLSTRVQETTEQKSKRVERNVNYGNMIVEKKHFVEVGGFDENNLTWGGDDDDIIHRLKLLGLREINPHNVYEAQHITMIHGDEERLQYLEDANRSDDLTRDKFTKIYSNKNIKNDSYLKFYEKNVDGIGLEVLYDAADYGV